MADKTNNIIYRIEVDSVSGKLNIDGVTKSFEDADRAVLKLQKDIAKGTQGASKEMNQLRSASGGATTSVLELGRVVSDAPYGIRGMANNVSQLASNMLFTSQQIDKTTGKAIGFKGVLKDMGKSFMGPLGILFAIQAVVAAVDYFYGGATKAAGAGKEFELSAKDLSGTLRDLHGTQDEVNDKIDEYITLMMKKRAVAKLDAESNKEISRLDKVIEDAKAVMFNNDVKRLGGAERLTKAQIDLANKTYNAQKEILDKAESDRVDEFKNVIKRQQDIEDLDKKMKTAREGTLKSLKDLKKEKEKERELNADSAEEYKRLTIAIDEYQKKIEEIEGKKDGKRPEVEHFDIKGIKEGQGKVLSEMIKLNDKMLLASLKDKKSRLIVQRDFHIARLAAIHGDNSEIVQTYKKYYRQLIDEVEQGELELLAKQGAKGMGKLKRNTTTDADDILTARLKKVQDFADRYNQISASVTSFMDGEFQRQLTTEQNKTNAINNELRERLNNENLSADERKNIQLKISRNDEALRRRQEKIKKKQFKLNKAANIASALVSTYSGASAAYFNTLKNPANALDPTAGLVRAKINAGVATAIGLANVAMIARQKFQSSISSAPSAGALGSGGGSGSGRGDRSFDFNLAGASRENQLAQTLQGRFDQPLQAYVVSRDITNKQQLDEDIRNNASFG